MVVVYHRTTDDEAKRIGLKGFRSMENPPRVYVSNRRNGEAVGYGDVCLAIEIEASWLELDDEFPDGEQHYAIPVNVINAHGRIVAKYA